MIDQWFYFFPSLFIIQFRIESIKIQTLLTNKNNKARKIILKNEDNDD